MNTPFNRREFVKGLSVATAAALLDVRSARAASPMMPEPSPTKLPRWRGFNLLEKFIASVENTRFRESDFAWMSEWGFNFARLPLSYRCWSDPKDWHKIDEKVMKEIDEAIALGRQYGVHVCLNFHRAPGYSVDASLKEPFNLWSDAEALEACAYHWGHFAARYKDVPNSALSFDLINEPGYKAPGVYLDDATYARVAKVLVEAIRAESPHRQIIADGLCWGTLPVPALADLHIGQSTRGYAPMEVTHWKASWVAGSDTWPAPTWPLAVTPDKAASARQQLEAFAATFKDNPIVRDTVKETDVTKEWDRTRLEQQLIRPWKKLEAMGVGVHVGEFGAHNFSPHPVVLAWMRDILACWKDANWGWALWNFRGSFGVLDSKRTDVKYEAFRGHQLDREMLELLRAS